MSAERVNLRTLAGYSVWNGLAVLSRAVFGFVLNIILVRRLDLNRVGEFHYYLWLAGLIAVIAGAGIAPAIIKYISEFWLRTKKIAYGVFWAGLKHQLLINLTTTVLAGAILYLLGDVSLYVFAGLILYANSVVFLEFFLARLRGMAEFKLIGLMGPVQLIGGTLFVLIALLEGGSAVRPLYALAATNFILVFPLVLDSWPRRGLPVDSTPAELMSRVKDYALSMFLLSLVNYIVWQKSEIFFLNRYSSPESIALYSLPFSLVTALGFIPAMFTGVLLPALSDLKGRRLLSEMKELYRKSVKLTAFVYLPVVVLGSLFSRELLVLLFGKQLASAAAVFVTLLFVSNVVVIAGVNVPLLQALEKHRPILASGVVLVLINVLFAILLIPSFAVWGAVAANSLTHLVALALSMYIVKQYAGVSFPLGYVLKGAIVVIVSLGWFLPALFLFQGVAAKISGAVGFLGTYALLMQALPIFSLSERQLTQKPFFYALQFIKHIR